MPLGAGSQAAVANDDRRPATYDLRGRSPVRSLSPPRRNLPPPPAGDRLSLGGSPAVQALLICSLGSLQPVALFPHNPAIPLFSHTPVRI